MSENKYLTKVCALLRPPVKKTSEQAPKKNKYAVKIDKLKKRHHGGETTYRSHKVYK